MTTLHFRQLIGLSPLRLGFLLIPLALGCFALAPHARAVCQEGCLTNNNTVLGDDALVNNTGTDNMAIGFNALFSNTTGSWNTANGFQALGSTTGSSNTGIGYQALAFNTRGTNNIALGASAGINLTTGSDN